MIGYITLGTNDLERAGNFYDALLAVIGAKRVMTDERMLGWGTSPQDTMFSVISPYDGEPATSGNGVMIALNVETAENVEKLYRKALDLGAEDEGHPHDRGSPWDSTVGTSETWMATSWWPTVWAISPTDGLARHKE